MSKTDTLRSNVTRTMGSRNGVNSFFKKSLSQFPEQFCLGGMSVYAGSFLSIPRAAATFSNEGKSSTTKACPSLLWQGVGNESPVSHGFGGSPGSSVESGAAVWNAVSAATIHLQRPAVIGHPTNRPANYGYPANLLGVICNPDREFVSHYRIVMTMVLGDEGVCLLQRKGNDVQSDVVRTRLAHWLVFQKSLACQVIRDSRMTWAEGISCLYF